MTTIVSIFGIVGRFAGDLMTSALGWASSLLFGRVPRSHQVFLTAMMAGSFLWMAFVVGLLVPSVAALALSTTPHPPFVDFAWLAFVLLVGVVVLPLGVGLAGYLVPADGERPAGRAVVREILRGYLLAPVISGLLIFLAGVGIVRKVRSQRHGWSDTHVPIVVKPGGYEQMAIDLRETLVSAGLPVVPRDAPRVLTGPAWILTRVAGGNVRKLRPDRLIELRDPVMRIGLYPSDIAISCAKGALTRVRAAIVGGLATTEAHMTTSAEAQALEDRLQAVASRGWLSSRGADVRAAFEEIDAMLLELVIPTEEWDILYRLRLQIDRDLLSGVKPGTVFPGHRSSIPSSAAPVHSTPMDVLAGDIETRVRAESGAARS